ncbi:4-amino-4-deoxy-L-arabinose transferase-like glycosyltransferase [Stella humosa]|uniref:4-amino-4-deoxy-L-arabinose transferase-like glycosyltransferase n=1 Tax=Stella humosa TaxID=94 RepID=A0A3N1LIQ0_9PROT|nr:glycosyltransferase family 39 protein [Stella humosa]ROP90729.1 4-amino-4-deoxy-L-arabinose transferase-like glycosyltransferase [Stella humosa]
MRTAIDAWSAGRRPYLLLVLLCLALHLPGLAALPPFDRDEARFVQATRQMLDSGDFVQIRFQDEARNKKPVGIHWLQAASVGALSDAASTAVWPYRLVSAAAAMIAVLLTFALGAALFGRPAALLGAAVTAGALVVVTEAHLAKTDAALLASALAVELGLARIYLAHRAGQVAGRGAALLFWAGIGVAGLIKGPVVPALALLAAGALTVADRSTAWLSGLRTLWGLPLAVALVAPWLVLVSSATDGAFLGEAIRSDLLPKLTGGQESHGAPPGYYLALLAVTAWPASLFVPLGIAVAWFGRRTPGFRFALAWIVPGWLLFELVPTKLPHYVMPLYPTLFLLAAHAAWTGVAAAGRWRWAMAAWLALWAAVGLGLGVLAVATGFVFADGPSLAAIVVAAAALAAVAGGIRLAGRDAPSAMAAGLAGAVVVFGLLFAVILPRLDGLWLGRSTAALLAREGVPANRTVVVGYSEPSLVFLAGTAIDFADAAGAARHLAAGPGNAALIGDRDRARFAAAAAAAGLDLVEGPAVRGLNYSRGRWTELTLYRRR